MGDEEIQKEIGQEGFAKFGHLTKLFPRILSLSRVLYNDDQTSHDTNPWMSNIL